MSDSAGVLKKMTFDNDPQILTADIEVNFWQGGLVNTETLENVGSATMKTMWVSGFISGITTRLSDDGSMVKLFNSLKKTTTEVVPVIFEFANGEKFSGAVKGKVDTDSFYSNTEAKGTFDLVAVEGTFSQVK